MKCKRDDKTIDGARQPENDEWTGEAEKGVKGLSLGEREEREEREKNPKKIASRTRCGQKAAVFRGLFFSQLSVIVFIFLIFTPRQGQFASRVHLHSTRPKFTLLSNPKELRYSARKLSVRMQTSDLAKRNLFSNAMHI